MWILLKQNYEGEDANCQTLIWAFDLKFGRKGIILSTKTKCILNINRTSQLLGRMLESECIPYTSRSNEEGHNTSIETFKQVENIVLEQVLNKFELLMTSHNFSFPFKHTTFNQQSIVKINLNCETLWKLLNLFISLRSHLSLSKAHGSTYY